MWARGITTYEQFDRLSFVDSLLVAVAREYSSYSFDSGFDAVMGFSD